MQAFLANRASNVNLSSAAATAALRAHTPTPTPVADVQTKRMLQRRASASSNGSANGSRRPGVLQRQNSSGSMTERTFREPSPNRGTPVRVNGDNAPPVPAVPQSYASPPPIPTKSVRRPASVEPPERIGSPLPRFPGGRGVSLDRGPGVLPGRSNRRPESRVTSLGSVSELERTESRGSVNFSRPMSPQSTSPISPLREGRLTFPSSELPTASKPHTKTSTNSVSGMVANPIQHSIQQAANAPVKQKKKVVAQSMVEGSHFANGGMGGRPTGTAVDDSLKVQPTSRMSATRPVNTTLSTFVSNESSSAAPKKPKRRKDTTLMDHGGAPQANYASDSDSVSERSFTAERPRTFSTRAAGLLTKQPSIVREDREAEEKEESGSSISRGDNKSTQNGAIGTRAGRTNPNTNKKRMNSEQHNRSTSQPLPSLVTSNLKTEDVPTLSPTSNTGRNLDGDKLPRHQSLSPSRAAHFSSQPMYETPDGAKHQPPPRSLSPAKSALKYSPSSRGPSPAGVMPGGWNRRAPSEASDTTSVISEDGYKPAPKKKNVRVSFDDDSIVVGRASSPPTSPESPVILSPQSKEGSKKSWFSLGRDKKQTDETEIEESMKPTPKLPSFGSVRVREEQEQPQVTTSVNTRFNPQRYAAPWSLDESSTSSDRAVGSNIAQDFAVRGNDSIADTSTIKSRNDPLPPDVTSVEGVGYNSDTEGSIYSEFDGQESRLQSSRNTNTILKDREAEDMNVTNASQGLSGSNGNMHPHTYSEPIPSIAVHPATPGLEDLQRRPAGWLDMPGGFPTSTETVNEDLNRGQLEHHQIIEHQPTDPTPASIGIAEPEPEAAAANHSPTLPAVGEISQSLRHQTSVQENDESDDTGNSIYSDAAEDLSDIEGDGFGSINAIVESPGVPTPKVTPAGLSSSPSKGTRSTKSAKRNTIARTESELSEPTSEQGWDKAQEYWSGLSQGRRKQLEHAATPDAVNVFSNGSAAKPKKKTKGAPEQVSQIKSSSQPAISQASDRQGREKAAFSTSINNQQMKKSMRGPQVDTSESPHIRNTMRESARLKPSLRQSMQKDNSPLPPSPQSRGALQKKQRPVSAVAMVDYNQAPSKTLTTHNRAISDGSSMGPLTPVAAQATQKPSLIKSNLRRTKSNDSDSASSFKRQRSAPSDNGRYTMKRSMRDSSMDARPKSAHANQSSGFSVRSLSPTDSTARRPFSSSGPSMRTSMRDSANPNSPRNVKSPKRSFGLSKEPKVKNGPASRISSRFGGSSDEDDGPRPHNSRFADSSDEDEPRKLPRNFTPVRGIPKRIDEGDSTDLEDSSEEAPKRSVTGNAASLKTPKFEGAALASGSLRPNGPGYDPTESPGPEAGIPAMNGTGKDKKKRSFFGGLGKKKDDAKVPKIDMESAGPHDKPLEHDRAERTLGIDSPDQSPRSPKLQRRTTPKRFASDSWPLPQNPAMATTDGRPSTADAPAMKGRPELGSRRSTAQGVGENGVVVGKSGKKKRFPMLRKAFGLHD